MKNYYHILNVPRSASMNDIKAAYRKLSKKLHPDQNQGDTYFEEYFKEVQEAYEVLSNTTKRQAHNWDLDNKNGQSQQRSAKETTEHEQKLQRWFEEMVNRQQAVFNQRAEEMRQVYAQHERRFQELEKDWKRKVEQSAGEVKNIWTGAAVVVFLLLILSFYALQSSNHAHQQLMDVMDNPPVPKTGAMVSQAELNALKHDAAVGDFWREMLMRTELHSDPLSGVKSKYVGSIYFYQNAEVLHQESSWRMAAATEFLKTVPATAKIYLYAYANTSEAGDTTGSDWFARNLVQRRVNYIFQYLQHNGIEANRIELNTKIELCPTNADEAACRGRGRVEITVEQ